MNFWLRTIDEQWYVHELRGVCYVSWVTAADKANAAIVPEHSAYELARIVQKMSGRDVEIVQCK